jgi:hypothetical protein
MEDLEDLLDILQCSNVGIIEMVSEEQILIVRLS